MIKFGCESCGQRIRIADEHAGRQGKCPKCREVIVVPADEAVLETVGALLNEQSSAAVTASSGVMVDFKCTMCNAQLEADETMRGEVIDCPGCSCCVEVPQEEKAEEPEAIQFDKNGLQVVEEKQSDDYEDYMPGMKNTMVEEEPEDMERKFFWPVDIFFYALNKKGVLQLGVFVLGMILLDILSIALSFILFGGLIMFVICLFFWGSVCNYYVNSIRDSAEGKVRVQESPWTVGAGGFDSSDLFGELLPIIGPFFVCVVPWSIYIVYAAIFEIPLGVGYWASFGVSMFLFPMIQLRMVLLDGFNVLNPFSMIWSIVKTPFSYIFLSICFCILIAANIAVAMAFKEIRWAGYISTGISMYFMLIFTHVLGRYYFLNEEKLEWGV